MILVTGAAGKTGQAVIRALAARGEAIRALVHRPQQARVVKDLGAQQVIAGDMRSPGILAQAVQRARAIYHICPNMSPDESTIGQAILAAAQPAKVEHFVYHSVLHPQTEAMPHHWQKLRTEERLFESGLPFTILQPAAYMQNVLAHWDQILAQGLYPVPYAVETRLAMVDLEDAAEAAALVLTQDGHLGATYELVGPEVLSQLEVAAILGQELGRTVHPAVMSIQAWEIQARASGLGVTEIETLVKMFQYYERHGFWGNSQVLGWLLGRPPTTFAGFVQRAIRQRAQ
jgi:NAD(P)H dehydrogenase (quinone)